MTTNPTPELCLDLEDSFARALPELHAAADPDQVPAPEAVVLNVVLAEQLGLDPIALDSPEGVAILSGNATPAGTRPTAMAYAGHQFGGYSPLLGDGRAVLLGELVDNDGNQRDVHLKGSGRTPFSRGGDGKAALGPMLREFLIAEAMYAMNVPTGRALAVVTTGEDVYRDNAVPGAVLTRVAASHIRVGTFEYASRSGDPTLVRRLADYAITRHYPDAVATAEHRYLAFFEAVVEAQAKLVAEWMLVGFVHGVMNTDNVLVSGETIDYGPCAFLDRYDPATVFSSIDHDGRYSYGHQPTIAQWNLARFAETLLPLINPDRDTAITAVTGILEEFPKRYERFWLDGMRTKLGLVDSDETDIVLVADLLNLMEVHSIDYTSTFRALANSLRGDELVLSELFDSSDAIRPWMERWRNRLEVEHRDLAIVAKEMDLTNPMYIPRNHLVEESLEAAADGDLAPFHALLEAITEPFTEREGWERFAAPASAGFDESFRTFCGT